VQTESQADWSSTMVASDKLFAGSIPEIDAGLRDELRIHASP
jgi:hypothetical protein